MRPVEASAAPDTMARRGRDFTLFEGPVARPRRSSATVTGRRLELELVVASGETRERLARRLHVPGAQVRIERVATGGNAPHATVRIAADEA